MQFLEKNINNIEKQYNNKKNKKRLIFLLNTYYLGFLTMDKITYLNKAYNYCAEYLNKNKSDIDILLAILFFSINIKDKEKIDYFNSNISKYKKYLRNNDEEKYEFYLFLQGLIRANKGAIRSTNKYIKYLQNIESDKSKLYIIFLKIIIDDVDRNIMEYIKNINDNSFYKNIILYNILEKKQKFINIDKGIFKNYIKWSLYNGINIEKTIIRYENSIMFNYSENTFNKKLYFNYNLDFILIKICEVYLQNNIHNKYSYFFFKEAINRQLSMDKLNNNYIKACYKNNMEDIGLYPIRQFLKEKNKDIDLMLFIYYIILNDKKYNSLVLENKNKILQYSAYFLEKGCTGKYYYTLYKYLLDFVKEDSLEEKKIMDILYPNNFLYEIFIEDNKAKVILIKDYEIDSITEYRINNNKAIITASSTNFYYYVFTEEKKDLLDCKVKIKRVVERVNGKYFNRFYQKGYRDKFTLINTVRYFLECDDLDSSKIEILQEALNLNISIHFKMKILLNIGNINFYNENYEIATSYYKKVLEKYINDKYLDNILKSYIICKEYEKSIEIIKKKAHILSDDVLFYAIKNISEDEKYDKDIAVFAYELLLRSKVDNIFIEIVLKNYKGSLKEWIELRKSLETIGILKKEIDEHILKITIYTHSINSYSEKIFLKLYQEDVDSSIIEYFLNYCMYEAFNGDYIFSDDVLYIMEYIFKETNYNILGYALAHIYLKGNYNLENKNNILNQIIKNMEKEQIGFKIFENNKDKFKDFSYLYKNKPFIYNTVPNREVYLHYKNINQDKFLSIKMKYFKFGIYIVTLPIFYGEDIEYYFVENIENGSIATKSFFTTNNKNIIFDIDDIYFKINNAFINIYEGKYNQVHNSIEQLILKDYNLKGKIL
ncbi:DUF5717 family protein [[Clostridium] colinum]|uniref:DUF5717 family protein n=1 Tax=[Clostridium] colinum TaxID=36835 RepID=UPI0020259D96|nr:DUF5717 family protein [[Clostridium] colinum]